MSTNLITHTEGRRCLMAQPTPSTPTHPEQMTAAADTSGYVTGLIHPDDMPASIEARAYSRWPAVGLPDVVGLLMYGVPSLDALERLQALLGGQVTRTRRSSPETGWSYTEHELIGTVRGIPFLASATADHEPIPASGGTTAGWGDAPDMVMVEAPASQAVSL